MKRSQGGSTKTKAGANHRGELVRVNRIRGQIDGIGRMIAEDAYCPTIITQIQAVRSALASLQANLLKGHLEHCVRNELRDGSKRSTDALVSELIGIFKNTD